MDGQMANFTSPEQLPNSPIQLGTWAVLGIIAIIIILGPCVLGTCIWCCAACSTNSRRIQKRAALYRNYQETGGRMDVLVISDQPDIPKGRFQPIDNGQNYPISTFEPYKGKAKAELNAK